MARRRIIAGNWKMNMTPSQAVELVNTLKDLVVNDAVDVVYCVPAIDIVPVAEAIKGSNVKLGAENFYIEDKGAFTGEISAPMLKDAGVEYIIIGHSERRDIFGENDILINQKVKKAFAAGLKPILCCGETLEQRESGVTLDWIRLQIKTDLAGVSAIDSSAYQGDCLYNCRECNRADYALEGTGGTMSEPKHLHDCRWCAGMRYPAGFYVGWHQYPLYRWA